MVLLAMATPATTIQRHSAQKLLLLFMLVTTSAALYLVTHHEQAGEYRHLRTILYLLLAYSIIQQCDVWALRPIVERTKTPALFHAILKVLIYFAVCFTVLRTQYGFDIMPLLTTSAVLSFVLGLALQDTLGNFFAGITINIEEPYKVGDWIKIDGTDGQVAAVSWRTTKLHTLDQTCLIIPNSHIAKATIENRTTPYGMSASRVACELAYDIPPNRAKEAILEALHGIPEVQQTRPPLVQLLEFRDSGIAYSIKFWLKDWQVKNAVDDAIRTRLWYALKRRGLSIPYPIREVHLCPTPPSPSQPISAKIAALQSMDIFAGQPDPVITAIATTLVEQTFGRDECIYEEGAAGDSLLLLTSGKVAVEKQGQTIVRLGPGSFIGEMSLLTGECRSATVRAITDCTGLELSKAAFKTIVAQHQDILERISDAIARRQGESQQVLAPAPALRANHTVENEGKHADSLRQRMLSMMKGFLR